MKALGRRLDMPDSPTDIESFGKYAEQARRVENDEEQCLDELWAIMCDDKKCAEVIKRRNLSRAGLDRTYMTLSNSGLAGTPALCALADADTLDYMYREDVSETDRVVTAAHFCKRYGV